MKKTLRSILAGALALLAVSCYDDSALRSALASLESRVTELENKLNTEVGTINSKIDGLDAAYKLADKNLTESIQTLTSNLDALDGSVDGLISAKTDILAAIEDLKKADKNLADKDAELLADLVGIGITKVEKKDGDVVLTFVDGTTLTVPAKPENGIVTVIEEDGVKYWAVVVNGQAQSLDVKVGHPSLEFEVDPETNELLYSVDGGEFEGTGAFVADDQEYLLTDFYQGETDEMDWETFEFVKEDFYTLVFGGVEYQLPLYKVDNSVIALKAGKTYFEFGAEKTIDVVISDITSIYVMSKPDGWRAKLVEKKLTVTAPAEAAVVAGYAEADGEVLLHCTTAEGKCKIAKLAVATTSGFSLVLTEEGGLTITNPEVVTVETPLGETLTDFNDAIVGLAPVASFEADPLGYVKNIDNNYDDLYYYLSNWKMNTADVDEDWNMVYTIGGAYKPGVYEVDVIETTVPQMYADWTYGDEIPSTPFVVWACPVDENGMPRTAELVYAYYYPVVKATISEVAVSTSDVEVTVSVVGAERYCVGLVTDEQLYGFPIDSFMQMSEGPFGQFKQYLQWAPEYALEPMGTQFGGEFGAEMPETVAASMFNYGEPLMPNTHFYMWVFPIVEGVDLADYTYEKNLKPYIYEFTTSSLSAGGSVTAVFGEEDITFSTMNVDLSADGAATMIYYNYFDLDTFNAFANDDAIAAALLADGYVIKGDMGTAVNQNDIAPGSEFMLATLAVDAEGKYGDVKSKFFAAPTIEFSDTFTASFGESASSVYYSGYKYDFPISVAGGEAAKYYYVWSTTEYTDDQLKNLPLTYAYDYNFRSTTNVAAGQLAGQYANASSTYYLAVVVESTTGELSSPIKMTVEVPAVPAE